MTSERFFRGDIKAFGNQIIALAVRLVTVVLELFDLKLHFRQSSGNNSCSRYQPILYRSLLELAPYIPEYTDLRELLRVA